MVRWWRLLALPLSGLVLVAGCGGAGREVAGTAPAPTLPPAPAVERPAVPPLGVTFSEATQSVTIAPLDPVRVRPLSGPRLEVKGGSWSLTAVTPHPSLGGLTNNTRDLGA